MIVRVTVLALMTALSPLSAGAQTYHRDGDHMGWWAYGTGGMFMWIILLLIIAAAAWLIYRSREGGGPGRSSGTPLDILKRRYASGEITKEEYESMRKDLLDGE